MRKKETAPAYKQIHAQAQAALRQIQMDIRVGAPEELAQPYPEALGLVGLRRRHDPEHARIKPRLRALTSETQIR